VSSWSNFHVSTRTNVPPTVPRKSHRRREGGGGGGRGREGIDGEKECQVEDKMGSQDKIYFQEAKILGTHAWHLAGGKKKEGRSIRSC